jgi:hypothetical protein
MKAAVCAVVALALAVPAAAQSRYDRKLEEAAAAIVAAKIGSIRGGFAFDAKPVMIVVRDDVVMGSTLTDAASIVADERLPDGMERAIDRPTNPVTTF